jgi:trehalose/maltose hydrolase-like predicted phosphorylase
VFAFQQYIRATKDRAFLSSAVYPAANNTARYWAARTTLDTEGQAHILDIQPPDEWHSHVNDAVFTNAGAIFTLRFAADTADYLGDSSAPVRAWRALADRIVILHNSTTGTTAEYAGFDGGELPETRWKLYPGGCPVITPKSISLGTPCIKQADTSLLQYPLGFNQSEGQAEKNLNYYAPRVDPHGTPAMTCASLIISPLLLHNNCSTPVI